MDFAIGATWGNYCKVKKLGETTIQLSGMKSWMDMLFEQFQKPGWKDNRPQILETESFMKDVDIESMDASRQTREHPTRSIEHLRAVVDLVK